MKKETKSRRRKNQEGDKNQKGDKFCLTRQKSTGDKNQEGDKYQGDNK